MGKLSLHGTHELMGPSRRSPDPGFRLSELLSPTGHDVVPKLLHASSEMAVVDPDHIRAVWRADEEVETSRYYCREFVRLPIGLGLIISDYEIDDAFCYRLLGEGLVLFQFRLSGASIERWTAEDEVCADAPLCTVSFQPDGYERALAFQRTHWRSVAIFASPQLLAERLALDEDLPPALRAAWSEKRLYRASRSMSADMLAASNAVLQQPYRGSLRRVFLEAKCLELICAALDAVRSDQPYGDGPIRLRPNDIERIHLAYEILSAELADIHTLSSLARRVGVNRSKLAYGFRHVFGATYHDCLRRLRMDRARQLLCGEGLSVSQVALEVGYEDASGFSRAFRGQFGVAPREARRAARNS